MDRADHCEAMLSMTGAGARRPGSIPGPVCTVPGAARDRCTLSSSPREPPFCSRCAEAMQSCNQTIAQTNEKHDRTRSRLSSGNEAHGGSFPMANELGAIRRLVVRLGLRQNCTARASLDGGARVPCARRSSPDNGNAKFRGAARSNQVFVISDISASLLENFTRRSTKNPQ